eukprot:jgi/Mesvir1/29481/Mv06406-RA.1
MSADTGAPTADDADDIMDAGNAVDGGTRRPLAESPPSIPPSWPLVPNLLADADAELAVSVGSPRSLAPLILSPATPASLWNCGLAPRCDSIGEDGRSAEGRSGRSRGMGAEDSRGRVLRFQALYLGRSFGICLMSTYRGEHTPGVSRGT